MSRRGLVARALVFFWALLDAGCGASPGSEPGALAAGGGGSTPGVIAGNAAPGLGGAAAPTASPAGAGAGGTDGAAGTTAAPTAGTGGVGAIVPPVAGNSGDQAGSGGSGTPPTTAMPCSGKTAKPGTSTRSLMSGALLRTFNVHIPAGIDANAPVPLLFVHHGFTMSGQIMQDLTGFDAIADSEKFVVVYPDGGGAAPWNVGTGVCGVGAVVAGIEDDFAFVDAMVANVAADQCIDESRIFTTGFSMGGYFSNHIGCQRGHSRVRAVAPHSGGTYPGDCPGAPLPVMIVHGTGDALITPDCGQNARDLWVQRNGCQADFDTIMVTGGHCERYKGCPAGGQVEACFFDGMAHAWAGGVAGLYGTGPGYESASKLIWDFFKAQL